MFDSSLPGAIFAAFSCYVVSMVLTGEVALLTGRNVRVWPIGIRSGAKGPQNTWFGKAFLVVFAVLVVGAVQLSMLVALVYPGSGILARGAFLLELVAAGAWLGYLARLPAHT